MGEHAYTCRHTNINMFILTHAHTFSLSHSVSVTQTHTYTHTHTYPCPPCPGIHTPNNEGQRMQTSGCCIMLSAVDAALLAAAARTPGGMALAPRRMSIVVREPLDVPVTRRPLQSFENVRRAILLLNHFSLATLILLLPAKYRSPPVFRQSL